MPITIPTTRHGTKAITNPTAKASATARVHPTTRFGRRCCIKRAHRSLDFYTFRHVRQAFNLPKKAVQRRRAAGLLVALAGGDDRQRHLFGYLHALGEIVLCSSVLRHGHSLQSYPGCALFRRNNVHVVWLPALYNLDLAVRMGIADTLHQRVRVAFLNPVAVVE